MTTAALLDIHPNALAAQGPQSAPGETPAAHFLHEALHSAQRRLALSTVTRLLLARDKRLEQGGSTPFTSLRATQAPAPRSSARPAAPLGRGMQDIQLSPETLKRIRLECQISDLRRSLNHIETSTLPHRTKSIVSRSIEDQLTALQERHAALCHAAAM